VVLIAALTAARGGSLTEAARFCSARFGLLLSPAWTNACGACRHGGGEGGRTAPVSAYINGPTPTPKAGSPLPGCSAEISAGVIRVSPVVL